MLDASECPPTFSTPPDIVQGIIAGGNKAVFKAVEGAEDDGDLGRKDLMLRNLKPCDVVVGIAASGRTPYVIGALEYAAEVGAERISITCNPDAPLNSLASVSICPVVGPEVISGSTRMKAGTAQKMVLNMLSTAAMIKLGKVYKNLMVDVNPTNKKLMKRACNIVKLATGADENKIKAVLDETGYSVKLSIMMQKLKRVTLSLKLIWNLSKGKQNHLLLPLFCPTGRFQ
nr:N-acetylmuramic acid 6-phosphate etherase [Koleobacter methoxysyntrophicus]